MSTRRPVIGIMGAGDASPEDIQRAAALGEAVARRGWVVLTGGRDAGVMAAASAGAKRIAGSLVIGVLPDAATPVAPDVDVAIMTGMGQARNAVNVLSSDVIVAVAVREAGTASEVALALKARKPVVLLAPSTEAAAFFTTLGGTLIVARTVEEAVEQVAAILDGASPE